MNPELRRNFWLELSIHRLVAMPVVLALVFALFGARGGEAWTLVFTVAFWIFVLLVHFWGTRQAAEAVTEEVRDRTWDWQRLSSLGPWEMTVGKLFGPTSFAWYGAAWCLVAMAIAQSVSLADYRAEWVAVGLVASGLALHGAALAGSLQASRKDSRLGARVGVLLLIPVAIILASGFMRPGTEPEAVIEWFGAAIGHRRFIALSSVAFAAWAVLAVNREMSRELKVRVLPWAYPAFAVFLGAYLCGLVNMEGRSRAQIFVVITFLVSLALTYYGLFADVTTAMSLRRLAMHARARDWRRVLEELPLWAVALALGAAFALVASAWPPPPEETPRALAEWVQLLPIVSFLAVTRDAGLLVFFTLAPRARRSEGVTLLYIALLWWVLPGLLEVSGLHTAAQAFRPFSLADWQAALVMAAHVAIVWGGVAWRWRRMQHAMDRQHGEAVGRGV